MSTEISPRDRLLVKYVKRATERYRDPVQKKLPPEEVSRLDELDETLQEWVDGTGGLVVARSELVVAEPTIMRAQTIWESPDESAPWLLLEQESRFINEARIAAVLKSSNPSESRIRTALPYPRLSQRPDIKLHIGLADSTKERERVRPDLVRITFAWSGDRPHPIIRGNIANHYRTFNEEGRYKIVPLVDFLKMRATINTHAQRAATPGNK